MNKLHSLGAKTAYWNLNYEHKLHRHDICHMHHMQRMCKIISPRVKFYIFKGDFWTINVGIISVFGNIHSCKAMINYEVILQVKHWDIILVLGLEILNCHSKGPYMIFVIFSPRTTFWPYVVSTQKVRKLRQNRFRDKTA